MPAPVIAAIIAGGATVAAGTIGSHGQQAAADTTSKTATEVATIQKQASDAALKFQQDQAQQYQSNFVNSQNANYNQWLYQQGLSRPYTAMGTGALDMLGGLLGVHPADLPPTPPPPTFTTNTMPGATGGNRIAAGIGAFPSAPTGGNPTDPTAINAALMANYNALGVSPTGPGTGPTDSAYFATQIAKTGGLTADNFGYWFGPTGRIATELGKGSSSAPNYVTQPTAQANLTTTMNPYMQLPNVPFQSLNG